MRRATASPSATTTLAERLLGRSPLEALSASADPLRAPDRRRLPVVRRRRRRRGRGRGRHGGAVGRHQRRRCRRRRGHQRRPRPHRDPRPDPDRHRRSRRRASSSRAPPLVLGETDPGLVPLFERRPPPGDVAAAPGVRLRAQRASPSAAGCSTCAPPAGSLRGRVPAPPRRPPGRQRRLRPRRRRGVLRPPLDGGRGRGGIRRGPGARSLRGRAAASPLVILDGAHNPAGAEAAALTLDGGLRGRGPPRRSSSASRRAAIRPRCSSAAPGRRGRGWSGLPLRPRPRALARHDVVAAAAGWASGPMPRPNVPEAVARALEAAGRRRARAGHRLAVRRSAPPGRAVSVAPVTAPSR